MGISRDTLFEMVLDGRIGLAEFLSFEASGGIHAKVRGQGLLHLAIDQNNLRLTRQLLEAGIDPNAQDNDGATPLRHALRRQRLRHMALLLDTPNLQPELDTVASHAFPHPAQPVALDLGRRGTPEMARMWQGKAGEETWAARGAIDEETLSHWWPCSWRKPEQAASALDCAILSANLPMINWLLDHTDLLPTQEALEVKLRDHMPHDMPGFRGHPGLVLARAINTPEAMAFWEGLRGDPTQTEVDVALALRHFLEQKRLARRLPEARTGKRNGRI
jgi:hypothetical protein